MDGYNFFTYPYTCSCQNLIKLAYNYIAPLTCTKINIFFPNVLTMRLCCSFIGSRVEVALQGTALPVLLSISPSPVFKFGDCPVGEQIDALCTVNNESASLPLTFSLHCTAHFHASPSQGYISAGQSVDVLLSFKPNQMGIFNPSVPLEVLGGIVEQFSFDGDPTAVR